MNASFPAGKVVIVTGGSAGLGRALSVALVQAGATVHVLARSQEGLQHTLQLAGHPDRLHVHVASVTEADSIESLFRSIVEKHGHVDLLINNAAVYPRWKLGESAAGEWGAAAAINLTGVANGCRAAIRTFAPGRAAVVLNVGSFAYLNPGPGDTLYCATKAGVSALTKAVAVELAAAGSPIVVNEWMPGVFKTAMSGWTGDAPESAFPRLLAVWQMSLTQPGGRRFEQDREWFPPVSRVTRVKQLLRRVLTGKGG